MYADLGRPGIHLRLRATEQSSSVTAMTHVKSLQAGHSSQGTSKPITPAPVVGVKTRSMSKQVDAVMVDTPENPRTPEIAWTPLYSH